MRSPWIIAHRGASGHAPENTITAFKRAVELGARFIETDLHLTRDARFVAIHDPTLDRTTNANGEIARSRLEDLRQLDNAYWFCPGENAVRGRPPEDYVLRGRAPADRDLGVATLSEVLEAFPGVCSTSTSSSPPPRSFLTRRPWPGSWQSTAGGTG